MLAPSQRLAQLVFMGALGGYAIVAACGGSDSGPAQSPTVNGSDAGSETQPGITLTGTGGGAGGSVVFVGMDAGRQLPTVICKGSSAPPIPVASGHDAAGETGDLDVDVDGEADSEAEAARPGVIEDAGRETSADAGECPLPESVCFDGQWLTYFTGGTCVDGLCEWNANFIFCRGGGCYGGQCQQILVK